MFQWPPFLRCASDDRTQADARGAIPKTYRWPWQPGDEPCCPEPLYPPLDHEDPAQCGDPAYRTGAAMKLASLLMSRLAKHARDYGLPREQLGASGFEHQATMNLTLGGIAFRVTICEEESWYAYRDTDPEYLRLKAKAEEAEKPRRDLADKAADAWAKVHKRADELQAIFEGKKP